MTALFDPWRESDLARAVEPAMVSQGAIAAAVVTAKEAASFSEAYVALVVELVK